MIRDTTESFIKKAKAIHHNKFNYSEVVYELSCKKVKIYCKKCKHFFMQKPNNHLNGEGCPYCRNKATGKRCKKTTNAFIKEAKKLFGKKYNYSAVIYNGAKAKVKIYCNTCKRFFYKAPDKHLCGKQGCPYCSINASLGENSVAEWLIANNIQFIRQKRFLECKDIRPLPFDFYLPAYNICIEFQGRQHYYKEKNSKFQKTIADFLYLKKHDNIKKKYCEKNNITLIEIKYNENIIKKLESEILFKENK